MIQTPRAAEQRDLVHCSAVFHIVFGVCIHKHINISSSNALQFAPSLWANDIIN